jgi:ferritin-like metal-binding protein YciE
MDSLRELLIDELSDLYSAEKQLVQALPKMAKAATSKKLQKAFTDHLAVTKVHVTRLEAALEEMSEKPKRKKCKAMEGLVEEGAEVIKGVGVGAVKDASLNGTARAMAETLGLGKVAKFLQSTLDEEKKADADLNALATTEINEAAMAASA